MAKQRHQNDQTDSSKTALVVLTVGVLLVAALVVWALTRTVEPASVAEQIPTDTVATSPANPPAVPETAGTTATGATSATTAPATAQTPPPVESERGSVARIAVEDLRDKYNAGQVTIIDVRDAAAYQASHIPGALNIPMASIESQFDLIPKGKDIVTYCT